MSGAFTPYAPLNTPKVVADDVWIVDGPEIGMAYMGATMPFPTRMSVVRLTDGGLFIHSPIAPDEALFAAVDALGPVRHLIAPNSIHYWYVPDWSERYPGACVHVVPGLAGKAKRPLPPASVLGEAPNPAWASDLDQVIVPGTAITEAVFHHRASRTVILTDLIENFEPARVHNPWLLRLMRLAGAADPDGRTPVDMQLNASKNPYESGPLTLGLPEGKRCGDSLVSSTSRIGLRG